MGTSEKNHTGDGCRGPAPALLLYGSTGVPPGGYPALSQLHQCLQSLPALASQARRAMEKALPGAGCRRSVGWAEPLLLPETISRPSGCRRATRVLRRVSHGGATMLVLRFRAPPWQQHAGVFRCEIKNSDSRRDELRYRNVIS